MRGGIVDIGKEIRIHEIHPQELDVAPNERPAEAPEPERRRELVPVPVETTA